MLIVFVGFVCFPISRALGLGREIEFVIKPKRLKGTQCLYPEIFSAEEGVSYLLFRH